MGEYENGDGMRQPATAGSPSGGFPGIEITGEARGTKVAIRFSGELRYPSTDEILSKVSNLMGEGYSEVLLDLRDVSYCDTAGLGVLVQIYKQAVQKGTALKVFVSEGAFLSTLRTCNFQKFMKIMTDARELEAFSSIAG